MLIANIFAQRLLGVSKFTSPTSSYFTMNLVGSLVDELPLSPQTEFNSFLPELLSP